MEIEINDEVEKVVERIKSARQRKGMSQLDLALEAGISQGFLATIESHQKIPTILTLIKIAYALDINPALFFSDEKQKVSTYRQKIVGENAFNSHKKSRAEKIADETLLEIIPAFSRTLRQKLEVALKK